MKRRVLVVVGLAVVVVGAIATAQLTEVPSTPIWVVVAIAGLGLVSTLITYILSARLQSINERRGSLARYCLNDEAGGLPRIDRVTDLLPRGVRTSTSRRRAARQAEHDVRALSGLGEAWEHESARGYDRFGTSLELSIESVRMNTSSLNLLAVLGVLPDGVDNADVEQLMPGTGDLAGATLREVGLAYDEQGVEALGRYDIVGRVLGIALAHERLAAIAADPATRIPQTRAAMDAWTQMGRAEAAARTADEYPGM